MAVTPPRPVLLTMRIEKNCPLPQTHNRLRQAHDLWHEVAVAYPDADAFVMALNNFISTARSVTFVLQTESRRRDQERFNPWYEEQQAAMRADPRMKWLHDSRTDIQKKGDLDTHSVAKVSVAATDAELDLAELEVPPLLSPAEVAERVKIEDLPERIRKQAVMVVERRWTVNELPDDELLDTLGYCYGRIADVARQAHELFGVQMQTFGGETHGGRHHREQHPSGRLACMLPTTEIRTAYWHLGEESLVAQEIKVTKRPSGEDSAEIAAESKRRYGDLTRHRWMPGTDLVDQARALHRMAREILVADGYHHTFAWLFCGSERAGQYTMTPEDHQDTILKMRTIAQEVEEEGADAVIITTETWTAPPVPRDDERFGLRATDRGDREETLMTTLLRRTGDHREFVSPMSRDPSSTPDRSHIPPEWAPDGAIILGAIEEGSLQTAPVYSAIFKVWERWEKATRAPG